MRVTKTVCAKQKQSQLIFGCSNKILSLIMRMHAQDLLDQYNGSSRLPFILMIMNLQSMFFPVIVQEQEYTLTYMRFIYCRLRSDIMVLALLNVIMCRFIYLFLFCVLKM